MQYFDKGVIHIEFNMEVMDNRDFERYGGSTTLTSLTSYDKSIRYCLKRLVKVDLIKVVQAT